MRNYQFLSTPMALLTCLLLSSSCGGGTKRTADLLYDIRAYNEGIRWQKFPQSAVRILPADRDDFLDVREELEDDLRVDDFEITRMKVSGKDKRNARVQIKWTWHMDSKGIVHTTTTSQKWKRFGKRWMMLEEFHVRGEEMPGVSEAPEMDEGDTESGDKEPALAPTLGANSETKPFAIDTSLANARFSARNSAYLSVEDTLQMASFPPTL